jgi:hypothetical protein
MLRVPSLSSATSIASSSWKASGRAGVPERGDREPWTTNVADHGHDLDRLAIGVLLIQFAEERSAARARAGRLRNDQWEQRDRTGEGTRNLDVANLFGLGRVGCRGHSVRLGSLPDGAVPALVAFALSDLGVRSTQRRGRKRNGYWNCEVV